MRCAYCYEGTHRNKGKMSIGTLKKAIDFIVTHNHAGDRIDLVFLGGEPLLNKKCLYRAVDIIKNDYPKLRDLFHYSITTNGLLMDQELIRFFKDNAFQVSLSMDGNEHTYNLNRKGPGSKGFETIRDNLSMLVQSGTDICVRMTVTANTAGYLSENVCYLLTLGVKKIHIGLDMLAAWGERELQDLDRQMGIVDEIYLSRIEPREDYLIDIYDYKISTFVLKRRPQYCSAGTANHLVINSKGEIFPCGYVSGNPEWKLGNLADFNSRRILELLRSHVKNRSSCQDCPIAFTCCGAKCGFLNLVKTGCLNQHHQETCKVQEILFRHDVQVMTKLYRRQSPRLLRCLQLARKEQLALGDTMKTIMEKEATYHV